MNYCPNFQERSFLATFTMDVFFLSDVVYAASIFFKLPEGIRHLVNNWWDFDVLGEIFILLKTLFVWSRPNPRFNQKTKTYGDNTTYARIRVFTDPYSPYTDRIVGSVLIRENKGQWKPVFSHILCSLNILKFIIVKTGSALKLLLLPKVLFRVVCVFFVPLLVWGRITP